MYRFIDQIQYSASRRINPSMNKPRKYAAGVIMKGQAEKSRPDKMIQLEMNYGQGARCGAGPSAPGASIQFIKTNKHGFSSCAPMTGQYFRARCAVLQPAPRWGLAPSPTAPRCTDSAARTAQPPSITRVDPRFRCHESIHLLFQPTEQYRLSRSDA